MRYTYLITLITEKGGIINSCTLVHVHKALSNWTDK